MVLHQIMFFINLMAIKISESNVQNSSQPCLYDNCTEFNLNSVERVNFSDYSENVPKNCMNHSDFLQTPEEGNNNSDSTGLFTLANMACERANLMGSTVH